MRVRVNISANHEPRTTNHEPRTTNNDDSETYTRRKAEGRLPEDLKGEGTIMNQKLSEIDASIRSRNLRPRALAEETGLTTEPPVRQIKESDSYWFTRLLTYNILGMSYRTPQLNMDLLQEQINGRTFGKNRIESCVYIAPGTRNLRFKTPSGEKAFFAREEIDTGTFLSAFGLS